MRKWSWFFANEDTHLWQRVIAFMYGGEGVTGVQNQVEGLISVSMVSNLVLSFQNGTFNEGDDTSKDLAR